MTDYTYEDWADLLADFFFDSAHAGEEILFAVDDRSLAEASGHSDTDAAHSLAEAVSTVVGQEWLLAPLDRWIDRWRRGGLSGPHPALPFLGITVLAASRMGEHESFAAHNYYVPLRRLLNPDDTGRGAPGSFTDHIGPFWHDLQRWADVDLGGSRGRIVIRDTGHLRYVGLAIQHALVRSSDLRQLDAFFRRIGLEPGEEVPAPELRRALAVWATGRGEPWGRRLVRISTDPDLVEYCEALLAREAQKWDGHPRDPRTGRPVGRIRIGLTSLRHSSIGLYLEWDERLPTKIRVATGSEFSDLTREYGWYSPSPVSGIDVALAMLEGLELRTDASLHFDLRADTVYALAYEDDLGAWVSVDSMSYGDRYHLVVRQETTAEVLAFAQRESSARCRLDVVASALLPPGWILIRDVQIDARPQVNPPVALASLVPVGGGPRIRLLGGLPIGPSQGAYLRGGEPALALNTLGGEEPVLLLRESTGVEEQIVFSTPADREIPLWPLHLDPDTYGISHGLSRVRLQIIDGIADAAGPGVGSIHQRGSGSIRVAGTEVFDDHDDDDHRPPVTVPAPIPDSEVTVLGPRSEDVLQVEIPTWLSSLVGFELSWVTTDAWPQFDPVWCLQRSSSGQLEASMLNRVEPGAAIASASRWATLIAESTLAPTQGEVAQQLWREYQEASGVIPC